MGTHTVYTRELLESLVPQAASFTHLARLMDKSPVGGTVTHLHVTCDRMGINTSHFTGQAHNRGKPSLGRKLPELIFVLGTPQDRRCTTLQLRRAMIDEGIEYKCDQCPNKGEWNNKPLTLDIDHRNGKYWDNRIENLRFMCPNCHRQTETHGNKKRK